MTDVRIGKTQFRRSLLLWTVRFVLHQAIKLLVLAFLGIRFLLGRKFVRYGLLLLLLGVGIARSAVGGPMQLPWQSASSEGEIVSDIAPVQLPRPRVVERYLKAQADYNATGMWEAMSERLKQRMTASNSSLQQLQVELDSVRQRERRYTGATYVGGVVMDGGRSAYFYVLIIESPNGSAQIPFTFLLDQDGKIVSIQ